MKPTTAQRTPRWMTTLVALSVSTATIVGLAGPTADAAPSTARGTVTTVGTLTPRATPPAAARTERITYWTRGIGERPALSSAAVYLPAGTPPRGGWPVIAWAHGTTGLADACAYSIGGPVEPERDWAYLDTFLKRGYAIVASDYAGLGTPGPMPYLHGKLEANSVIDGVAAARSVEPSLSPRWATVGQSQGGGAAMFTARYAPSEQAAGLDYRGAVATGVPAYIEDVLLPLAPNVPPVPLPGETTLFILYIMAGLRDTYPHLGINTYLTPAGRWWVDRSETFTGCGKAQADQLAKDKVTMTDILAKPIITIPGIHPILKQYMGIPESGYTKPIYIGQGLQDVTVSTPGALALAAVLRAHRQPVTFDAYNADHDGAFVESLPRALAFVDRIMR